MTTKDAIKLLPISEDIKLQILKTYDYMDEDQKLAISRIAWKTYDLLRVTDIDLNIEKQFEKVKEGQEDLGSEFFQEVLKNSNADMSNKLSESLSGVDLATARQAMHQIVREIQDAKTTKKHSVNNN